MNNFNSIIRYIIYSKEQKKMCFERTKNLSKKKEFFVFLFFTQLELSYWTNNLFRIFEFRQSRV